MQRGGGGDWSGNSVAETDVWSSLREWPRYSRTSYMSKELPTPDRSSWRVSEDFPSDTPIPPKANESSQSAQAVPASNEHGRDVYPTAGAVRSSGSYVPTSLQTSPIQPSGTPRSFGVHSMLNPTQPEPQSSRPSDPPASRLPGLIPRDEGQVQPSISAASPRSRKRPQRNRPSEGRSGNARPSGSRRTLTPISPARRAESLGSRQIQATASNLGQALAPAGGRAYTAEPGRHPDSNIPPLPDVGITRGRPTEPQALGSASNPGRPFVGGYTASPDIPAHARPSESPRTSASSYSLVSQPSPIFAQLTTSGAQQTYAPQPIAPSSTLPPIPGSRLGDGHRHHAPGQQPSLQMTLNTEQGTMVVPVDVQQASKTANEKRKRNASASARFRARRKEKEKEASHTIVSLEKDLKDIADDRDHYRSERDYYRELAARHVDLSQLAPRPISPSQLDSPTLPRLSGESTRRHFQEEFSDSPEPVSRAPLRRRTGDSVYLLQNPVTASPMLPPQLPLAPPTTVQPLSLPSVQIAPSLPNLFIESRPGQPGPSSITQLQTPQQQPPPQMLPNLPPITRSQSYDPFRPERFDRGWDPSRP